MPFIRIFGLINAYVVENGRQRRELEQHEHVSPELSPEGGLVHRLLASRFAQDVGLAQRELPVLATQPEATAHDFGAALLPIHSGEIYEMATYVAGGYPREDIEVVAQRWLARRFKPRYEATAGERAAARLIGGWHRRGPMTALAGLCTGRLQRARETLAASVPADLHVAYAPALLLPYIVQCLERMRRVARHSTTPASLSPDAFSPDVIVSCCLAPPRLAFRTCRTEVEVSFAERPLPADSLVIVPARRLAAGEGSSTGDGDDSSRQPAMRLIRRLLTQVWVASREVQNPAAYTLPAAQRRDEARSSLGHGVLASTVLRPAVVKAVAAPSGARRERAEHEVTPRRLPSVTALASLSRTLPYGNAVGRMLQEDHRRRQARARAAAAETSMPETV